MRVALFSGNYNYLREGANQALNRLVRHLEDKGHDVRVYSPVTDTPAFEPAGTLVPVPSLRLPVRSEFRLALGLNRAIRADLERFAPDLVHVSTPDLMGCRAQSWARRRRIPVIASLHTRFETYLAHYGLGWLRPLGEAHLDRFYRRSDHVLVPIAALAADMARVVGKDRVSVWGRGVDRDLFDPARRDAAWRRSQGLAEDEVAILYFGRLVREKGVGAFAATMRRLEAKGAKARALIVGAGPARSAFDGLRGAILTGHLEGEALARAVASADILLNPSTTEAFGNVLLESMASGLAVVSADAANARTLIDDGRTGLLCRSGEPEDYAREILGLIAAPGRRRALGEAARAASAAHSWGGASEGALHAYERVLARRALPASAFPPGIGSGLERRDQGISRTAAGNSDPSA